MRWAAPLILLTLRACMIPRISVVCLHGGIVLLRKHGPNGITFVPMNSSAGLPSSNEVSGIMARLCLLKNVRN